MYNRRRGSILAEYILTLMIILMLIPITLISLSVISLGLKKDQVIQDVIADHQIRRILSLSYDAYIENDTLHFNYQNKERTLSLVNGNLILQPGTEIMYVNVDIASFYQENNTIFLFYTRGEKMYEKALLSQ